MTSYQHRPPIPTRMEFQPTAPQEPLLPPPRSDIPAQNTSTSTHQKECECNYNSYATKKTIGHGLLEFALLTSNAMQLRTLSIQKQRDAFWIASLILVCISILIQVILAYVLIILGKGNIQDREKQTKLEKYNNIVLFLTMLISVINIIINAFMTSTSSANYFDPRLFESSGNHT